MTVTWKSRSFFDPLCEMPTTIVRADLLPNGSGLSCTPCLTPVAGTPGICVPTDSGPPHITLNSATPVFYYYLLNTESVPANKILFGPNDDIPLPFVSSVGGLTSWNSGTITLAIDPTYAAAHGLAFTGNVGFTVGTGAGCVELQITISPGPGAAALTGEVYRLFHFYKFNPPIAIAVTPTSEATAIVWW